MKQDMRNVSIKAWLVLNTRIKGQTQETRIHHGEEERERSRSEQSKSSVVAIELRFNDKLS